MTVDDGVSDVAAKDELIVLILLATVGFMLILAVVCWSNEDDEDGDRLVVDTDSFLGVKVSVSSSSSKRISFVASKLALISFLFVLNSSSISSILFEF